MTRNEVYIGNIVQNKKGKLSYKTKTCINKPIDEWIRVENTHEPIIGMDVWDLCRELDEKNFRPRSTGSGEIGLFAGLLKCMDCGFTMKYSPDTRILPIKGRTVYTYYICGNYSRGGKFACSTHNIYQNALSELILEDLRKHTSRALGDEKGLKQDLISQRNKESLRQHKSDKEQLKRTQGRLAELERLIQSLYENMVLGSLSDDMCKNLMAKYEQEREEKSALLQDLTDRLAETEQNEQNIDSFLTAI